MPRRRPGTVRERLPFRRPQHEDFTRDVQGVSPRAQAAIRTLELTHDRLIRGGVLTHLLVWRRAACGSGCDGDQYGEFYCEYDPTYDAHHERGVLETVLEALPRHASKALLRVVRRIDDHHESCCSGYWTCGVGRRAYEFHHGPMNVEFRLRSLAEEAAEKKHAA